MTPVNQGFFLMVDSEERARPEVFAVVLQTVVCTIAWVRTSDRTHGGP